MVSIVTVYIVAMCFACAVIGYIAAQFAVRYSTKIPPQMLPGIECPRCHHALANHLTVFPERCTATTDTRVLGSDGVYSLHREPCYCAMTREELIYDDKHNTRSVL